MAAPRTARVKVFYDGKDITEQVSKTLLTFSFVDKASGEADELNITVHNRDGKWIKEWYPKLQVKAGE
ncbi:MAG: hypothetical protein LBS19_14140 [Clostridiales bacterium]|jgi:phage protein D|nr:hypothetical protein [Clostridiales bacterium]